MLTKNQANGGEVVLLENVEDVVRIVHPWKNYSPHFGYGLLSSLMACIRLTITTDSHTNILMTQ